MSLTVWYLAARTELLVDKCARDVIFTNHVVVRIALEFAGFGQTVTSALHLTVRETQRFRNARVCENIWNVFIVL